MTKTAQHASNRIQLVSAKSNGVVLRDDFAIARERMRHLIPWQVQPLPVMHAAGGKVEMPPTPATRERYDRLGKLVWAVQIWNTGNYGALR